MNLALFILFFLCALTGLLAWLVFNDSKLGEALRGLHTKLGLLLIIFFGIHIGNYFKWLLNMTKKALRRNKKIKRNDTTLNP